MSEIVFQHVYKSFPNHQHALHDINFTLASGEMAFLTGHSGAGKSTLLNLIILAIRPTRGQIFINQQNITQLPVKNIPQLRSQIGMVYQDPMLVSDYNVFDNVALPLIVAGYKPNEIKRRVHAALYKVDLLSKENYLPIALSSGEKQRVSIARAIVNRPHILIADEPTGNCDPELSIEIIKLFAAFNAVGVTVLLATHDVNLIQQFPCRTIKIERGALMQNSTAAELRPHEEIMHE